MNIIRPNELARKVGLSRTTIWRLEKRGSFPARIRLSENAVGYLAVEVERWIEARQKVAG